ncbi:MAG: hypothetical protein EP343_24425 [Deltaproteobacteria bacterium]|nr:MAG: hypothetical protein EP343_24425 [Deltaproteobacteria bacterium]
MKMGIRSIVRVLGSVLALSLVGLVACSSPPGSCRDNSECQSYEVCNVSTSRCQSAGPVCGNTVCEVGETCSSCASDCACKDGKTCNASGVCEDAPACFTNADCQSPKSCENKMCVEPSAACDPACPSGQECNEGACVPTGTKVCTSDADCPANTKCSVTDALCVPTCSATQTTCPTGLRCDTTAQLCVPDNGGTGTTCSSDAQCKTGEVCDVAFQECAKACNSNADCSNDPKEICYTDEDQKKFCIPGCNKDSECQSTEVCDTQYNECAQKCSAGNTRCPEGQTCNISKGFCGVEGSSNKTPCSTDAQCKSGETCDTEFGECATTCKTDDDCPKSPREICYTDPNNKQFCIPGCLSDSDCEANAACDKEYYQCAQKCSASNQTCPQGEVCNVQKGLCDFE